ncbi:MAG TPA: hypothetical protein PLY93_15115, partial [Turneriella sp.]|nr:hypothetical protein [Turneriella sp.]
MRLWKGINKEGFLRYLPLVVYVTLTAFFLAVVYRVFLVYELKEIYTDMHLAPWALVRQTALEDFLLAFLIALPAVLLLFPESRARKRFAAALTVIFIFFYGTLLSASLLFVTIFEAPFQSTFFGQSLGTFQNAMFTSTLSELSLIPFRKAAPVFILMFATIVGFLFSRF